ncbi:hypothetical protein GCM10009836_46890 [Pseudonocardia ailaonensis]|uniref:Uncharacterized protein n=1 Tax=Pseudonocardia ailaonensis TaxID=367279 RepID=A0ABN2NC21_9PSEU
MLCGRAPLPAGPRTERHREAGCARWRSRGAPTRTDYGRNANVISKPVDGHDKRRTAPQLPAPT